MRLAAFIVSLGSGAALAAPPMPSTEVSAHPLAGVIVQTRDGAMLDAATLARAMGAADVAILGEVHDNPDHHAAQAWLVGELAPAALAFEMIAPDAEGPLSRLRAEGAGRAALGEALNWASSGWPAWDYYAPILEAAPGAVITGAAVSREAMGAAMREGAAPGARAALGAAATRYGLDERLADAETEAVTQEQIAAHCGALPRDVAAQMAQGQRVRDAALADAALRGRALGGDGRVALITGNGHARTDRGAARYLAHAEPGVTVSALKLAEVAPGETDWRSYVKGGPDGAPVFDYVWFTAAAPREDPCEAYLRARATP